MKHRKTVFSITENGNTRCGVTQQYAGLAGITLRLIKNANAPDGSTVKLFDRLDRMREISKEEYDRYVNDLSNQDEVCAVIEIDVDANTVRADEEMSKERQYHEYPLDLLVEKAPELVRVNLFNGRDYIDKERLYSAMDLTVRSLAHHAVLQEPQTSDMTMQI